MTIATADNTEIIGGFDTFHRPLSLSRLPRKARVCSKSRRACSKLGATSATAVRGGGMLISSESAIAGPPFSDYFAGTEEHT